MTSIGSSVTPSSAAPLSAESYYATQSPPPTLDTDVTKVRAFIARHAQAGRKVVLVTVRSISDVICRARQVLTFIKEWRDNRALRAQRVSLHTHSLPSASCRALVVVSQRPILGQLQRRYAQNFSIEKY